MGGETAGKNITKVVVYIPAKIFARLRTELEARVAAPA
jgi:hypothetical protein